MRQIKVGQTYKNGYGSNVRIIVDGRVSQSGFTFVGLLRSEHGSEESVLAYSALGQPENYTSAQANLILPRRYISLDDALSLIRSRCLTQLAEEIAALPFKEITE